MLLKKQENGGGVKRLSDNATFSVSIGRRVLDKELTAGGNNPVYSANVFEPFGYTDKLLIKDFSRPSIIWGIDGDWMVNLIEKEKPFYPTDHCGVIRILADDIHPRYMVYLLEQEGKNAGFSRSYRASIDRITSLSVRVPSITQQEVAMEEVKERETQISQARATMASCAARKQAVIDKYLK